MRFVENGPSIPDELLVAADQGEVVFFCGSGVSRQYADLPDFFGLAERVSERLPLSDGRINKLLAELKKEKSKALFDGLVSADRLFGLLESEFPLHEVERSVAEALKPPEGVNLAAHRSLIRLAKGPYGKLRLITTNFDRLFDSCDYQGQIFIGPKLPDPSRDEELDGIVYLHGCLTKDYSAAEGQGLVLTSSQFGDAYLAEGWATRFLKNILARHTIVFIGYSADDPPIRYLLEALQSKLGTVKKIYAFQDGDVETVESKWRDRGVQGIAYPKDEHQYLWDTVEAWSLRVENREEWYEQILEMASKGPEPLEPYQRGQVAHLASYLDGTKAFVNDGYVLPPEWLCVFDKEVRYANPRRINWADRDSPTVDPFEHYQLDSDLPPEHEDRGGLNGHRKIPADAWDAFDFLESDRQGLQPQHISSFYKCSKNLPSRIRQLGWWISKVCEQPATIWWAARQPQLHNEVLELVEHRLFRDKAFPAAVREAWLLLLKASEGSDNDPYSWPVYDQAVKRDGWSNYIAEKYIHGMRPEVRYADSFIIAPVPPKSKDKLELERIAVWSVDYSGVEYLKSEDVTVPNEWVLFITQGIRRNIERALQLEKACRRDGHGWLDICPINEEDDPSIDGYERNHGLSALILVYLGLYEQLFVSAPEAAAREMNVWPPNDPAVFDRLRIWAVGKPEMMSPQEASKIITELSDEVFWNTHHQRDLMLSLSARWNDFSKSSRVHFERRLRLGPVGLKEDNRARKSLNRIQWLHDQGCSLSFDLNAVIKKLRKKDPDWKPEFAQYAVRSNEMRGGSVETDFDCEFLLEEPVQNIITSARAVAGRVSMSKELNPFGGLARKHPQVAFDALKLESRNNKIPEGEWSGFFYAEERRSDDADIIVSIAQFISGLSSQSVATLLPSLSYWFRNIATELLDNNVAIFEQLMDKCIKALKQDTSCGRSSVVHQKRERDWCNDALNSPVGDLTEALFKYLGCWSKDENQVSSKTLREYFEELLGLDGDAHRYALCTITRVPAVFFDEGVEWLRALIAPFLNGGDCDDQTAYLSGFLQGTYYREHPGWSGVKPHLINLVKSDRGLNERYGRKIASIMVVEWVGGADRLSDKEFRDVLLHGGDTFRQQVLWFIEHQYDVDIKRRGLWTERLILLLNRVWPRQRIVRTPKASSQLCEMAFAMTEQFSQVAGAVLPLLAPADTAHIQIPKLRKNGQKMAESFPNEILAVLDAVLLGNPQHWPYKIEELFDEIAVAQEGTFAADPRLLRMKRIFHNR